MNFDVQEQDVYGSGRLGIRKSDVDGEYAQDFSGTITSGKFATMSYTGATAALS